MLSPGSAECAAVSVNAAPQFSNANPQCLAQAAWGRGFVQVMKSTFRWGSGHEAVTSQTQ
ncbi:hypothetical protein GGTG_01891 [Gaeumannomyces tritici R3-111a-1]|uniref:Uncharacterized protein n=1 Tax=Gaeumannomyces tritici (strain R3-111a-1) TaxID=644352 RepID=J3NKV0_GAET3|nr:hypothetical protein GGTG_01891 [Gaeumannomyces tritici R3-111a-1]EJT81917.1 hypothetical protein GGTG_01891 [Gaeumannomyces tritici R3-111a-1]